MGMLSLRQLLHRATRTARPARQGRPPQRPAARRRPVRRLAVEQLEDRTVLSTLATIPVFNPSLPNTASAGGVSQPFVSYDGRYIVYQGAAPNLVPNQVNTAPTTNIYLYDTLNKTTRLVSHVPGQPNTGANGDSAFPTISGDDRYVAYSSAATDLVAGQTGVQHGAQGPSNVFLYDVSTGTNTLISHAFGQATTSGNDDSATEGTTGFGLTANTGRYLLFVSQATNLVQGQDSASHLNLFLYDTLLHSTTLVSHAAGQPTVGGNEDTFTADISQDGSLIAYTSLATDLVFSQSGQQGNVFLYNTATNSSTLVSGVPDPVTGLPSPTAGAGFGLGSFISADGSFVGYISQAPDLVPGQTTDGIDPRTGQPYLPTPNVFGYSRLTGQTVLLSGAVDPFTGGPSPNVTCNGLCAHVALSRDGSSVAFISDASDLYPTERGLPGDARNDNTFVDSVPPFNPSQVTRTLVTPDVSLPLDPFTGLPVPAGGVVLRMGFNLTDLSITPDGRFITYQDKQFPGQTGPLVPGQNGPAGVSNAFVFDQASHTNAVLSRVNGTLATTGNADTTAARVSGNDQVAAFESQATNLNPSNVNGTPLQSDGANLFVFPAFASGPSLLSSQAAVQASAQTFVFGTSGDGRYVVFTSNSPQVVQGQSDGNADQDAFVYDRQAGSTRLVSHVPGQPLTAGNAGSPNTIDGVTPSGAPIVISEDGNWIAFVSNARNLVPGLGGIPQTPNIYLYDNRPGPTQGNVTLVTGAFVPSGQLFSGDAPSFNPVISADGSVIAFVTYAKAIFQPPPMPATLADTVRSNVYVYNRNTNQFILLSDQDSSNTSGNGNSGNPSISDDGRYVAFQSYATNLLSADGVTPESNIYLFDQQTFQTVLVSHNAFNSSQSANASSFDPVVSPDGSSVAFVSFATDLVSGQRPTTYSNVFVYDNRPGSGRAVQLLSGVGGSGTFSADGFSDSPALSGDGSRVAFRSSAPNLVTGQDNSSGSTSNVFLFDRNRPANPVTLVSHRAGNALATAAGNSVAPSIDGAGDLIAYLSTATNLVPGQQGGGVDNVFLYAVNRGATALLSGQGGSLTAPSSRPAFVALLSRDPIAAFDLLVGGGDTSVAFINTLVEVTLSPNSVAVGSAPGTAVGTLSVSTVFVGQFLPPTFGLPGGEANNALFTLAAAAGGQATLVTAFQASAPQGYLVHVHVNVGFGDDPVFLAVYVNGSGGGDGGRPVTAVLVPVRVGRHKGVRLMVEVFDLLTGAEVEALVCPFQAPAYRAISLTLLGPGLVEVTARKGKHKVTALLPV